MRKSYGDIPSVDLSLFANADHELQVATTAAHVSDGVLPSRGSRLSDISVTFDKSLTKMKTE